MQTYLLSQAELITQAKARGFAFAWGEPANRIRYWSTIGLIPHAIRKDGVGHYPAYTVDLLLKIQELQKQGMAIENIKAIVNREEMRMKVSEILEPNDSVGAGLSRPVDLSGPDEGAKTTPLQKSDRHFPIKTAAIVAGLVLFAVVTPNLIRGLSRMRAPLTSGEMPDQVRHDTENVLAGFSENKFLQFNSRVKFKDTELILSGDQVNIDQNLRTTDTPSFADLTINNTVGQITFPQAAGVVLLDQATQTLTNKSISGSNNNLSNIPNSALSNSKITINTSGSLSGGGDVALGSSINLSATDNTGVTATTSAGFVPKMEVDGTFGNSLIYDNGSLINVTGAIRLGDNTSTNNLLNTSAASGAPSGLLYWGDRQLCDYSGNCAGQGGVVSGSGIANYVARWTTTTNISTGLLYDNALAVSIGTSTPLATFDVRSQSGTLPTASISGATSKAALIVDNNGVGDLFTASKSGATKFVITNSGNVGIGTNIPAARININLGNVAMPGLFVDAIRQSSNGIRIKSGAGTGDWAFRLREDSEGDFSIYDVTNSANRLLININGNVGIGTVTPSSFKLQVAGNVGPNADLTYDLGSPSLRWANIYAGNVIASSSGTSGYWQRNSGALAPANITDSVNIGGVATSSALVHLAGTVGENSFFNTGNVGIGTTSFPTTVTRKFVLNGSGLITNGNSLHISTDSENDRGYASYGSSSINFRAGNRDNVGPFTIGAGVSTTGGNSGGSLTVYAQSGNSAAGGNLILQSGGGSSNGSILFQPGAGGSSGTTRIAIDANGNLGINTTAPTSLLDVRGFGGTNTISGIASVASISGKTSFATMVVDNSGVGDLFTASSSGMTRVVINQNGNMGIGTTNPTAPLQIHNPYSNYTNSGLVLTNALAAVSGGVSMNGDGAITLSATNLNYLALEAGGFRVANSINDSEKGLLQAPAGLQVNPYNASSIGLTVQGKTSQTANLTNWLDYLGNNLAALSADGNLGIGSSAPIFKLDLAGTQTATAVAMINNTSTSADADGLVVKLGFTGTGSTTNSFVTFLDGNGAINGLIRSTGANGVAYQTSGIADFGEYMKSEAGNIPVGTVVCHGTSGVKPCANGNNIAGVVSDSTAFLGGIQTPGSVVVGFVGQVYVKATGQIKAGDPVTALGTKATKSGMIVGHAVKDQEGDKVLVLVRPGYSVIASDSEAILNSDKIASSLDLLAPRNDISLATVSGDLKVTGMTELSNTSIGGKLTVGLLAFNDLEADISSLSEKLSIQGGSVLIAKNGDLTTSGKIEAKVVSTEKLNVLGDKTSSGSASLKASIGQITMPVGETHIIVQTTALTSKSQIFVTPVEQPVAVSARKISDDKFEIRIKEALDEPLSLNWWIVN